MIVDAFERGGVPVERIVACGGLPERNPLLMQIYADVLGREIDVAASQQARRSARRCSAPSPAARTRSIVEASERMAAPGAETYRPGRRGAGAATTRSTPSTCASTISSAAAATT